MPNLEHQHLHGGTPCSGEAIEERLTVIPCATTPHLHVTTAIGDIIDPTHDSLCMPWQNLAVAMKWFSACLGSAQHVALCVVWALAPPPPPAPIMKPLCHTPSCRPPYSSCRTPQSKRELLGVRYAVQGVDACESIDELAVPEHPKGLPLQQPASPARPQATPLNAAAALGERIPPGQPQGTIPKRLGPPQMSSGVGIIDEGTPLSSGQTWPRYMHGFLLIAAALTMPAAPCLADSPAPTTPMAKGPLSFVMA